MVYYVSVLVSSGYLILAIVAIIQLSRILLYGHKLLSFATCFLLLLLSWSIFRCLYFGFGHDYGLQFDDRDRDLLFYGPSYLQCATFSLILVYYEKHLKRTEKWRESKLWVLAIFVLSIAILAAVNITALLVYCARGQCPHHFNASVQRIHYLSFAIFYLCLFCTLLLYIKRLWKLHRVYMYSPPQHRVIRAHSAQSVPAAALHAHAADLVTPLALNHHDDDGVLVHEHHRHHTEHTIIIESASHYAVSSRTRRPSAKSVTFASRSTDYHQLGRKLQQQQHAAKAFFSLKFVVIFSSILLTRCLYFCILGVGLLNDDDRDDASYIAQENTNIQFGGLLCIIFWEWLPTILILAFFRHIPRTQLVCPVLATLCCCSTDDDAVADVDSESYCECCCYCCCCVCGKRAIKRRPSTQNAYDSGHEDDFGDDRECCAPGDDGEHSRHTPQQQTSTPWTMNNHFRRNTLTYSTSEASRSLPDIHASPPAPIIQKLIRQQSMARSWHHGQCVVAAASNVNDESGAAHDLQHNSLLTCDDDSVPSSDK